MAKKLLILHIGPDSPAPAAMRDRLALGGIALPEAATESLVLADLEVRRAHKAAGLKRKQVEGAWAGACRRVLRSRRHTFVSMPRFVDLTDGQAELAYGELAGLKVVLVVTGGFTLEPPAAWRALVKPGRTHLLPRGLTATQLADQVVRIAWMEQRARAEKRRRRLRLRPAA